MSHCETKDLTEDGVMHEGWVSTQLGLSGASALAEDMGVYKNILIAEETGARFHLTHNSSAGGIRAIREAKKRGAKNITADSSVQHFSLTDEECIIDNVPALRDVFTMGARPICNLNSLRFGEVSPERAGQERAKADGAKPPGLE